MRSLTCDGYILSLYNLYNPEWKCENPIVLHQATLIVRVWVSNKCLQSTEMADLLYSKGFWAVLLKSQHVVMSIIYHGEQHRQRHKQEVERTPPPPQHLDAPAPHRLLWKTTNDDQVWQIYHPNVNLWWGVLITSLAIAWRILQIVNNLWLMMVPSPLTCVDLRSNLSFDYWSWPFGAVAIDLNVSS